MAEPERPVLPGVVRELLGSYSGDHNWAQRTQHALDLALHKDEGCPSYRKDCDRCVADLESAAHG
jgi:hypothetical protein